MPRNGKRLVRVTSALATAALVAALAAISVGTASAKSSAGTVSGAGSTFVAPLVTKWMTPVKQQLGITLNYNPVGSGGGVSAIATRQADFGASDAPLSQFSPTCTTCVQIPWALAATAVIYNLSGLQHLNMTGAVLAKIYMGKITTWNNSAIKKINKGRSLPNEKITVVHRSDSSGTTYNFTDYLSHVSSAWKSGPGTGTSVSWWPGSEGEAHSSGVAGAVRSTPGAIGYTDVDYAIVNHLGVMKMQNRAKQFVLPRAKGIKAAAALDTHPAKDGSLSIVNPPAKKKFTAAYPICTYTYVDVQKSSGASAGNLKRLITWAITKGQKYGPPIVFEPLPKPVVTFDKKQIAKIH
jgi:phosphate transport system substrate-binding protein